MKIQLTIEEAIEALGRDQVARLLNRGIKVEHSMLTWKAVSPKLGRFKDFDARQEYRRDVHRQIQESLPFNLEIK